MNGGESQEESAGKTRRSQRLRPQVSYKEVEDDADYVRTEIDAKKMTELLTTRDYAPLKSTVSPGNLTAEMLWENGFREPIVVRPENGIGNTRDALGIQLPDFDLTVDSIVDTIGVNYPVNIIDVASQMAGPNWNLGQWREYYKKPVEQRGRLLNVVSLELAGSPLASMVAPPKAVRDIELIGQVWPKGDLGKPEVLLYGLMGVKGCITDFHIDFGGSSVWYHVISGKKVFLLVPPTVDNIDQFEKWSSCSAQFSTFYGDLADGVMRVELEAGCTMLIPAGWPHAVATPEDSIVVGGNFVHGLDMGHQLAVWKLEQRLKVHDQFRFPKYKTLMQHTAAHYLKILELMEKNGYRNTGAHRQLLKWELQGLQPLVDMLRTWSRSQKVDSPGVPFDSAGVAHALQVQIQHYQLAQQQDGTGSCEEVGQLPVCQKYQSNPCKHRPKQSSSKKSTKAPKHSGAPPKKLMVGGAPEEFLYFGGCGLDGKARKSRKMSDVLLKGPKRLHSLSTLRSWRDKILARAASDVANRAPTDVNPANTAATNKEGGQDGGAENRQGGERREREETEPASPGRCKRLKRLECGGEETVSSHGGENNTSADKRAGEVVLTSNLRSVSDSGGGAERVRGGGIEGRRDPMCDELMVAEAWGVAEEEATAAAAMFDFDVSCVTPPDDVQGGSDLQLCDNGDFDGNPKNDETINIVKKNTVEEVGWGHGKPKVSKRKPVFRRKSSAQKRQGQEQIFQRDEHPKKRKQHEGGSPKGELRKKHAFGVGMQPRHLHATEPGLFKPKDVDQLRPKPHDTTGHAGMQNGSVEEGGLEQLKLDLRKKMDLMDEFKAGKHVLCDRGLRLKEQISELRKEIIKQGGSAGSSPESFLDVHTPPEPPTLKLLVAGSRSLPGSPHCAPVARFAASMQSVAIGGCDHDEVDSRRNGVDPMRATHDPLIPPPPPPPPPPSLSQRSMEVVDLVDNEEDGGGEMDEGQSWCPPGENTSKGRNKKEKDKKRKKDGGGDSQHSHMWGGKTWTIKDAQGDLQGSFDLDGLRELYRGGKIIASTIVIQPFLGDLPFGAICPDQESNLPLASESECRAPPRALQPRGKSMIENTKKAGNLWDVPLGQTVAPPCSLPFKNIPEPHYAGIGQLEIPKDGPGPSHGPAETITPRSAGVCNDQKTRNTVAEEVPSGVASLVGSGYHADVARKCGNPASTLLPRFPSAMDVPNSGWPRDELLPHVSGYTPTQRMHNGLKGHEEMESERGVSEGMKAGRWWLPMQLGKEGPWTVSDLRFLSSTGQVPIDSTCTNKNGIVMKLKILLASGNAPPKSDQQSRIPAVEPNNVQLAAQKPDPWRPAPTPANKVVAGPMSPSLTRKQHQVQPHSLWRLPDSSPQAASQHGAISQPFIQRPFLTAFTTPQTILPEHRSPSLGAVPGSVIQPHVPQSILPGVPSGAMSGGAAQQQFTHWNQVGSGALASSTNQPELAQPTQLGSQSHHPGQSQPRPPPMMVVETGSSATGVPEHVVVVQPPPTPPTVRLVPAHANTHTVPMQRPRLIQGLFSTGYQLGLSMGGFQGMGGGVPKRSSVKGPPCNSHGQGGLY